MYALYQKDHLNMNLVDYMIKSCEAQRAFKYTLESQII